MLKIGLLSDTHHFLDESIFRHFERCDEIWHAGDFGTSGLAARLSDFRPLRGVYGNIDGADIRRMFPAKLSWESEGVKVFMTHIGGYPPRYNPSVRTELQKNAPRLFICGHSHILKIIYDESLHCLHMNPGAAGRQGWHTVRTLIRFTIDGTDIRDCEVIELGPRGS
ncbi:MAG TPA: metallophosphoesterase family protein [Puia sp.]|nr:metallophosphoesterase family protein [Puia sp.]